MLLKKCFFNAVFLLILTGLVLFTKFERLLYGKHYGYIVKNT